MSRSFQITDDKTVNKFKALLSEYLHCSRRTEDVEIKHTASGGKEKKKDEVGR